MTGVSAGGAECRALVVEAARQCVGTRFRPQGRVIGLGLDCVGVVLIAARAVGVRLDDVPSYALSGDNSRQLLCALSRSGCVRLARERGAAGDIAVLLPAPGQVHLGVLSPKGLVHAHAGLMRVVEGPVDPAWSWLGSWRLREGL